jgi:hypothetical protein
MSYQKDAVMRALACALIVAASVLAACSDQPATGSAARPTEQTASPHDPVQASSVLPPSTVSVDVSLIRTTAEWKPASVTMIDGKARIASHTGGGAFSAIIDLPEAARMEGAGAVRVHIDVTKGAMSAVVIPLGDASSILSERIQVFEADLGSSIDLPLSDLSKPASVLFQNGNADGQSTAVVSMVEVVRP